MCFVKYYKQNVTKINKIQKKKKSVAVGKNLVVSNAKFYCSFGLLSLIK